jgi:endonuclease YncB( thermonuclease family)
LGFWRKKEDGFDWQEYVRTTILLRRQDRRQKIDEMRHAAVESVKEGGRKGVDAAAAGLGAVAERIGPAARSAGAAAAEGLGRLGSALVAAARAAGAASLAGAAVAWSGLIRVLPEGHRVRATLEPLADVLAGERVRLVLMLTAGVAALMGGVRWYRFGADTDALLAAAVAVLAVLGLLIARLSSAAPSSVAGSSALGKLHAWLVRVGDRAVLLPGLDRLDPLPAALTLIAVVAASLLAAVSLATGWTGGAAPSPAPATTVATETSPSGVAQGRATVVAADRISIGGRVLRLDGIEPPDEDQSCTKPEGKSWRCGESAREALQRLVRGRTVTCTVTGGKVDGAEPATCKAGDADLAADLVRQGHVFAESGLFASYAGEEHSARSMKAGLWVTGSAERPAEWRARRWQEAKKEAPNGCPIKARVRSGSRTYLLPWSPDYDRAKVRSSRGDRWFCSEDEARAAGWQPGDRL